MRKALKSFTAAVLALIISASCITAASAALISYDEITWNTYSGSLKENYQWKSDYKGEIKEGKNEVFYDTSTYSFTPSATGFYAVSGDFWGFSVSDRVIGSSVIKYHSKGGTHGIDGSFSPAGSDRKAFPVYLKKGEKTCFSFFDHSIQEATDGIEYIPSPADITYLGEIASVSPDTVSTDASNEDFYFNNYSNGADLYVPDGIDLVFSQGGKYTICGIWFTLDSKESGKHNIRVNLDSNRGFNLTLEISNFCDLVERVELQEGYTPEATVDFDDYCYDVIDWTCPDYVVLYLIDGTEIKAEKSPDSDVFETVIQYRGMSYYITAQYELTKDGRVMWTLREGGWYEAHAFKTGFLAEFGTKTQIRSGRPDIIDYFEAVSYTLSNEIRYLSFQPLSQVIKETVQSLIRITVAFMSYKLFELRSAIAE